MKVSVIVPLYNERESIIELYNKLITALKNYKYEIIFIDDGSDDGSLEVLEKIKNKKVKIISFRKNYGKSDALDAGFKEASGDIIITIDADLQDEPNEIPNLIAKLQQGYDLVSGWKYKRKDPLSKTIPSKIFNFIVAKLTGVKIHDMNCGLKAYKSEVIKEISVYGSLHRFIPVLAKWRGFKISEVKVVHHPRKYGKTKFGFGRFLDGILDLLTVLFLSKFIKRPLHLFGIIGLFISFVGLVVCFYILYIRLRVGNIMHHSPLLIFGVLNLIVGIQFISMGLISELIADQSRREANYSIKKKF